MEIMDMTLAHKWDPMEKEGKEGKGDPSGQNIKGSRMARNCWSCQDGIPLRFSDNSKPSFYRGKAKPNVHAQHNTCSWSPLVQTRPSTR